MCTVPCYHSCLQGTLVSRASVSQLQNKGSRVKAGKKQSQRGPRVCPHELDMQTCLSPGDEDSG